MGRLLTNNTIMNEPNNEVWKAESELAQELGVPRPAFAKWRQTGSLTEGSDWQWQGREVALSESGVAKVRALVDLGAADGFQEPEPGIQVKVCRQQGPNRRRLRCWLMTGGENEPGEKCTVYLIAPRVVNTQFVPGTLLTVQVGETPGMFVFDGKAPRRGSI